MMATIRLMRINMALFLFADRLIVRAKCVNATFYWKISLPKPPPAPRKSLTFCPRRFLIRLRLAKQFAGRQFLILPDTARVSACSNPGHGAPLILSFRFSVCYGEKLKPRPRDRRSDTKTMVADMIELLAFTFAAFLAFASLCA